MNKITSEVIKKLQVMQTSEKSRLTVMIQPDLDLKLRITATQQRKSISDLVAEAIRQYLKTLGE